MSVLRRRGLLVDDPLAAGEERSPAVPATAGSEVAGQLRDIPIDQIHANPGQPRKRFDEATLATLADSIRERGVLQPVIVRPVGDAYELVAGSVAGALRGSPAKRRSPRSSTMRWTRRGRSSLR